MNLPPKKNAEQKEPSTNETYYSVLSIHRNFKNRDTNMYLRSWVKSSELALITTHANLTDWDTASAQWTSAFEKQGNPVVYDNVDGSWGHHAKIDKPDRDEYCLLWYHFYVESKKYINEWRVKLTETESRKVFVSGWWCGE